MADYGHELAFGTFITPQNQRPEEVVALAQLTERAGLDLATFQDHPYQPAYLDTWTLLTWVAARTERLRIAPNVLNLPLRPPAPLARAAASLDLLSGGRLELGLGAGAFWDAIEAMGGRRLTPGQAVDALSESIDAIRQLWDVSERGGVRVEGEHVRVRGAKRGPAPAHEVELWIGAYKPRMLRLTGSKGDGWLPSLAYLPPEQFGAANGAIDAAAEEAGRDPRAIRRLLNVQGSFAGSDRGFLQGPPQQWIEQLLELVLEHGFSTFILAGDEPSAIERFGAEVAPALREAVARERQAAGTETGAVIRDPKARALRREGIDYEAVPATLTHAAVEPGDRAYGSVRSTYVRTGSPGLVLRPRDAEQVREALLYANEQDVPLAIRSGGHGISGRSTNDGGIVIDLGALNGVELLDGDSGLVRLGPGARWGEVAAALQPHGLAISSGDYGDVGVGGLATTGGLGFLARKHGLTIDRVRAAELVLADGSRVRADATSDPQLLWAVRGAGANFGIVTALELEAARVEQVIHATMVFEASAELLERWGALVEAAPRELTSFLSLWAQRGRSPLVQTHTVWAGDDAEAATDALTPLLRAGTLLDQQAQLVPYAAVVPAHRNQHHGGLRSPAIRAGLVNSITPELAAAIMELASSGAAPMAQLRAVGGAVNDLAPEATAYAHRHQRFSLNAVGARLATLNPLWDERIAPHVDGLYLSFDTDPRPQRLAEAFPGATLTRLRRLKAIYDPANRFDQNYAIPPAAGADADGSAAEAEPALA
ncbi:LLM class flavin-dependent oxidoreductase [Conexibacter sp. JD483]|uniref:LLM class flavin-dependent oxidoreductase n=1 Tax=unclassified Conexibacter TaxID=2627773 RepID=UPI00271C1454|nr:MULTISPECIES: LLM class flavin-dependent oxidoreductase [unclassified Conexibacter]MDO8187237.1 LLM class flavin-dependent oxidoreductase [Conexibacter sp. CPCC 205706]MDO8199334.1 LLM class flavin-dependent oxidoreductase [Conexibacter sp. CPCC 205762]MDR9369265.1 LLM class flavin-dependent oxidoreductase [Conexibacter sp. JD483]